MYIFYKVFIVKVFIVAGDQMKEGRPQYPRPMITI